MTHKSQTCRNRYSPHKLKTREQSMYCIRVTSRKISRIFENMLQNILPFCVLTCISMFYCGNGFAVRVTRDRSGDLFNNFEDQCTNITQGRLGCKAKKADCESSTYCCTCRCGSDFSTFRVEANLLASTCIENSKVRYGKTIKYRISKRT